MNTCKLHRLIPAVLLALSLTACGFTAPRNSAGFAELDSPGLFDTDVTMTLSLGPTLLRFAASHVDDDPVTSALLHELDGVRVRVYEVDGDAERVLARLDAMYGKLRREQWQPVISVREQGERTHLLVKQDDGGMTGLTVLTCDGEEVVIVNIMGELRPERFDDTLRGLGVENIGIAQHL